MSDDKLGEDYKEGWNDALQEVLEMLEDEEWQDIDNLKEDLEEMKFE